MNKSKFLFWLEEFVLQDWLPYFWLAAITILIYLKTISFDLTLLDDNALISESLNWLKNPANFIQAFKEELFHQPQGFYYRPLLNVSYMIDAQLGMGALEIFHLSNIFIHIIAAWLVFVLIRQLKFDRLIALLVALVFAIHPAMVQPVAWLPGRANSLFGLLALGSIVTFIAFIRTNSLQAYFSHLVLFGLTLFAKEAGPIIPVVCLGWWWLVSGKPIKLKTLALLVPPWLLFGLIWLFARTTALNNPGAYTIKGAVDSVIPALPQVIVSLGNIVLPVKLSTYPVLEDASLIPGIISLVLLVVILYFSKQRSLKLILFATGWWLLFLIPTFILPQSTTTKPFFLEQRLYLPIIGPLIVIAQTDLVRRWPRYPGIFLAGIGAIVIILSIQNIVYARNYKDALSYWTNAINTSPSSAFAHKQLGVVYYLEGKLDQARVQYQKAIELNPNEPLVNNNLGLVFLDRNDYDLAKQLFDKELAINPNYDKALFNLGLVYFAQGDKVKAREYWQKTLAVNPRHRDAKSNLLILENDGQE